MKYNGRKKMHITHRDWFVEYVITDPKCLGLRLHLRLRFFWYS